LKDTHLVRTELVHARDGRELDLAEDWVAKNLRKDMLNLGQALILLVVLVALQVHASNTRQTSEATASAYVKPDLPLIESVNFF